MNANRTGSAPCTPVHGSFYIPWFDPEPETYAIDFTTPTVDEILDEVVYVPPPPMDLDKVAPNYDPRKLYSKQVRKITMESLDEGGSIVAGPHRLPTKSILFADVEARERALRTDGTQYDGPSGTVSWYYRADMAAPRPIPPTSSVIRSQHSLPAGSAGERIGVDPLQTIRGGTSPAWRKDETTQSKKENKRFDPIQKNKKAGTKKRKGN